MICKITHSGWIDGYGEFTFIRNESYEISIIRTMPNWSNQTSPRGYFNIKIDTSIYKSFLNLDYFYTISEARDNKLDKILG